MLLCRLLAAFLISTTMAIADCSDVTLTDVDKAVLEEVKRLEKVGGAVNGIIAWSPVVLVMTAGSALEAFFTAANTDLSLHAEAVRGMQVIKIRKIEETLILHAIDIPGEDSDGCRQRFFETLASKYGALID